MTESSTLEKHDRQNWLFLPQKTPVEGNAKLGFAGPAASLIFHVFKVFWLAQKPVYDHGGHLIFVEEGTTKTTVVPLSLDLRTVFHVVVNFSHKLAPDKGMVASSTASVSSTTKTCQAGRSQFAGEEGFAFFQGLHSRLDTTNSQRNDLGATNMCFYDTKHLSLPLSHYVCSLRPINYGLMDWGKDWCGCITQCMCACSLRLVPTTSGFFIIIIIIIITFL